MRSYIGAVRLEACEFVRPHSHRRSHALPLMSTIGSLRAQVASSAFWSRPYSDSGNPYLSDRAVLSDTVLVRC